MNRQECQVTTKDTQKFSRKKEATALNELALITAEITISDAGDESIGFGGPKEQALAMHQALAAHLGVNPAPGRVVVEAGSLLKLTMTRDELLSTMQWLEERFPRIGLQARRKAHVAEGAASRPEHQPRRGANLSCV
jgi:hypothetical protein